MSDLNYVEIYPKVHVYRNVLKDPQKLYEVMRKSEETSDGKYFLKKWDPWAHFGSYSQSKYIGEYTKEDEAHPMFVEEKEFSDEVENAYALVLADYVKTHNINLPEGWRFSGCSYSKYNPQVNVMNNDMTMQYHTDFITSQKEMPGDKFFITCTMYINDDYKGGDIEFFVDGKLINHKPVAGDILVFPSTEPYYHGVKVIEETEKFFVRNFVMFNYEGSEEWLKNQRRYGAYKWSKMELERIEHDDPRNMVYLQDGKPTAYEDLIQTDGVEVV